MKRGNWNGKGTELMRAIQHNDIDRVRQLVDESIPLNLKYTAQNAFSLVKSEQK